MYNCLSPFSFLGNHRILHSVFSLKYGKNSFVTNNSGRHYFGIVWNKMPCCQKDRF